MANAFLLSHFGTVDENGNMWLPIHRNQGFRVEGFCSTVLPFTVPFDFRIAPENFKIQLATWLYCFVGPIPEPNENTISPEVINDDDLEIYSCIHV